MKYHLRRKLGFQVATYAELCSLLAEIEACLNTRNFCALSDDPFNPNYMSRGHFLIGEPLFNYVLLNFMMSNAIDIRGGKTISNDCNSSGKIAYLTTSRVCISVNAGRGPNATYNQAISSC